MALASISREAQHISRKLGLTKDLSMIDHAWALELGNLKGDARIVAIDNAALVVETESHSILQELSLRRRELLRKLNRHFPEPILRQIHVRLAPSHGS